MGFQVANDGISVDRYTSTSLRSKKKESSLISVPNNPNSQRPLRKAN